MSLENPSPKINPITASIIGATFVIVIAGMAAIGQLHPHLPTFTQLADSVTATPIATSTDTPLPTATNTPTPTAVSTATPTTTSTSSPIVPTPTPRVPELTFSVHVTTMNCNVFEVVLPNIIVTNAGPDVRAVSASADHNFDARFGVNGNHSLNPGDSIMINAVGTTQPSGTVIVVSIREDLPDGTSIEALNTFSFTCL